MKSPKEKAEEIVDKHYWLFGDGYLGYQHIQHALLEVAEILDSITFNMYDEESYNQANNFWENVKKEVEAYKK